MQDVGLYIHIPFCKMKCYYCDFPSFSGKEENMIPYAQALSKEIQNICKDKNIKSIFIGGGTPTYLSLQGWIILKEAIDKLEKQHIEFTIEGNPKTFTEEKLKLFREMGVNRISVGLQAWQEAHLKSLGRIHSLQEFKNTYDLLRAYGFNNINVDIMFGLPNQTVDQWRETLQQVISLNPEHISAYSLIIEEGTHFYKLYEKDQLILPNEEEERQMYEDAVSILKENGYNQYEISNFAKEGMECKHNLIYWSLENYVGCGSAAHSYLEGVRYRNEENIEKYICKVNNENNGIIQEHLNSKEENMEEFMFLGLRKTKGISTIEFEKNFGEDIHKVYEKVIEKYIKLELLKENNERIYLTPKGVELSNVVMSDFLL